MFRKNEKHLQPLLISNVNDLPEKQRERLMKSWAGVFYREFFCRLKEEAFAVLYEDKPSRPNIAVNVLVGLETLKAGLGWSDEEMHDAYTYNVQVRYALGQHELGEGDFSLRTMYNFRHRLSQYRQEHGVNLLEVAFEQVTDEQLEAYKIKTGKQRMDSTQIASNIREMSRLQLLVEVLQRVYRGMTKTDQLKYAEAFAAYTKGHAGQYVYRIRGEQTSEHLEKIGQLMAQLVAELKGNYEEQPVYQMLVRVYGEHFRVTEKRVHTKTGEELSASSLQSPDDLEATYRKKSNQAYKGYVANLSETCDPENEVQLITSVQAAANTEEDAHLMETAVPKLKQRMRLDELNTDGGYSSPVADQVLHDNDVLQVQTAIRGRKKTSTKLGLMDFEMTYDEKGMPEQIACPGDQNVTVFQGRKNNRFQGRFVAETCARCPLLEKCPTTPTKRDRRLRFSLGDALRSQRIRRSLARKKEARNVRAAVEATMRVLKHPFPAGKLPVRGLFRMTNMLISSATMMNIRRIQRHLVSKDKPKISHKAQEDAFWAFFKTYFSIRFRQCFRFQTHFSF